MIIMKQMIGCILGVTAIIGSVAHGQDRRVMVRTEAELRQAAAQARPGDRIEIAPGEYRGRFDFINLRGEAERPIVIAGADPDDPPIFHGTTGCFHLVAPQFVELHHLVLTGASQNGLNIDDGGVLTVPARGIVLSHLHVYDVGSDGNHDGIKLSGLKGFRIEHCRIERWGRGGSAIDMVGCREGVIQHSTLADDGTAHSGIQAKGGSRDILIRHCHFEQAGMRAINIGGSTGMAFFRPEPLHFEAKDITVEHCSFVGSDAPVAFVGIDGAVFRFNTIYRPTRWAARILQETRAEGFVPSRNGVFSDNLIIFRADALRPAVNVGPATAVESFTFARNWWYCEDDPERSRVELPVAEEDGVYGQDPRTSNAVKERWRLP